MRLDLAFARARGKVTGRARAREKGKGERKGRAVAKDGAKGTGRCRGRGKGLVFISAHCEAAPSGWHGLYPYMAI